MATPCTLESTPTQKHKRLEFSLHNCVLNFVFKMLTLLVLATFFAGANIPGEIPAITNEALECQLRDIDIETGDPGFFRSIYKMVMPSKHDPCSDIRIFPETDSEMRVSENDSHFYMIIPLMMSVSFWLALIIIKRLQDQMERSNALRETLALERKTKEQLQQKLSHLEEENQKLVEHLREALGLVKNAKKKKRNKRRTSKKPKTVSPDDTEERKDETILQDPQEPKEIPKMSEYVQDNISQDEVQENEIGAGSSLRLEDFWLPVGNQWKCDVKFVFQGIEKIFNVYSDDEKEMKEILHNGLPDYAVNGVFEFMLKQTTLQDLQQRTEIPQSNFYFPMSITEEINETVQDRKQL